jgi:hypothetical protein
VTNLATVALDVQLDMLRFVLSPAGATYLNAQLEAQLHDTVSGDVLSPNSGQNIHQVILTLGETYAVTQEITTLITATCDSMPGYKLHESDLPSDAGFVYLESPIVVPDKWGKPLVIHGFGWGRAIGSANPNIQMGLAPRGYRPEPGDPTGITLLLFTDPSDPRDHMYDEWNGKLMQRWRASGGVTPRFLSMWVGAVMFGSELRADDNMSSKFIAAFFRFIQETYVDSREVHSDRAAVKRSVRARKLEPVIRVVKLRRKESKARREGEAMPVEWQRQWMVGLPNGRWRNQWYPSLGEHRPKFILPYVKGPKDKPLIIDDKIFIVDR